MELFSIRSSCGLLLLCTFWSATDCTTTASSPTTDVTTSVSTVTTQPPATSVSTVTTQPPATSVSTVTTQPPATSVSTVTMQPTTTTPPPKNVEDVDVVGQTENSITIAFDQLDGISKYIVSRDNGTEHTSEHINATEANVTRINHTLDNLTPAQKYNMTLYSVSDDGRQSSGFKFYGITAPRNVQNFTVYNRSSSSITLQWIKSDDLPYRLAFNGTNSNFTADDLPEHVVPNLTAKTYYNFSLYTVFEGIESTGANLTAATAPSKAEGFKNVTQDESSITLQWTNEVQDIMYKLTYNDEEEEFSSSDFGTLAEFNVTGLQSATNYTFSLVTVFDNIKGNEVTISAHTAPRNAENVTSVSPTETTITLRWEPAPNVTDYVLKFVDEEMNITGNEKNITDLASGTLYNFTLFAVFAGLRSSGVSDFAATVPSQVSSVKVTKRTLTTLTLEWEKEQPKWEYLVDINEKPETVTRSSHTVHSLKEGTLYNFSITTLFHSLKSTTYQNSTVTTIDCKNVLWSVTETSIHGKLGGLFTNATASNGTDLRHSSGTGPEVQFTGLYPGATYNVTLMYDLLEQCDPDYLPPPLTTKPPRLEASCKDSNAGYSIYIEWDSPRGIWDSVEISVADSINGLSVPNNGENYAEIPGFQPAKKYQVSIRSKSKEQRSDPPYVFTCHTDARGVIAGAFFGVLIFLILACAVVFVLLRRPDIIRRNKPHLGGARTSVRKSKPIPLEKFPAHFNVLSADENKGFSLEYEDFTLVGTDQSQKAATTPENKPKNRFVNVLPYDRCRVKLTSSSPHNDYINASYMPGYNSDREFIAAQGPMPSTAADFWRMIWEQGVKGIVMVTNCTEGGRIKCDQYWPDSGPRVCGDLAIFTTSEKKESDWTLREFSVKNRRTSEERTVKHFHFTAWPDHGVPEGTEVLIQFRALVRRHIQAEAVGAPTVVHCSAGVGRTGTIIALDTLLQQMERENAVDINGFVYRMRLNRPHMVQTESQYVFLHQCVLDSLRPTHEEEPIYENEKDLIYANAMALREYENSVKKA